MRRREIDGLRALAVIPIVFFHAGFQSFSGGFVGVDVFFVISGYLITSNILGQKRAGTFSLVEFYERRARRILPALFVVMLVFLPFAWFLMLPDDLENFGESLVATAFFANNVLLWLTSGYWDLSNDFKPLRHTWSLGIEEQFYIIFPVLILLIWRFGKKWIWAWFLAAAVLSLGVAQISWKAAPVADYLLLPTRAWELLIGALLSRYIDRAGALQPKTATSLGEPASFIGVLLIVFAVLSFGKQTPFPSVYALIPTSGAALVILYADQQTLTGRLLGSRALVGIGLISYSLYLWHQPMFAFLRIGSLDEPTAASFSVAIVASIMCAAASWRWVEQPFRNREVVGRFAAVSAFVGVGAVLPAIGLLLYLNSGFINLWPELADIQAAGRGLNSSYNSGPDRYRNAKFTGSAKIKVLVVGNSFARDFINAGEENGYFSNSELSYIGALPCGHQASINAAVRDLIVKADYLIRVAPIGPLDCFVQSYDYYRQLGAKRVILIGSKNFGWNLNAVMRLRAPERYSYRARVLDEFWDENEKAASRLPSSAFVNLLGMIADGDRRVPVFTDDKKIISQDRMHLTRDGARFIGRVLFEHPLLAGLK